MPVPSSPLPEYGPAYHKAAGQSPAAFLLLFNGFEDAFPENGSATARLAERYDPGSLGRSPVRDLRICSSVSPSSGIQTDAGSM